MFIHCSLFIIHHHLLCHLFFIAHDSSLFFCLVHCSSFVVYDLVSITKNHKHTLEVECSTFILFFSHCQHALLVFHWLLLIAHCLFLGPSYVAFFLISRSLIVLFDIYFSSIVIVHWSTHPWQGGCSLNLWTSYVPTPHKLHLTCHQQQLLPYSIADTCCTAAASVIIAGADIVCLIVEFWCPTIMYYWHVMVTLCRRQH